MADFLRWQETSVAGVLTERRIVCIGGARQCGKTTLVKRFLTPKMFFHTLDNPGLRQVAESDPIGFVQHAGGLMIIDEIQHVPDLLSAIKIEVDGDRRPGQFLLTGSTNIQSLPVVMESLAGRISHVRLRQLTQGEIFGTSPHFLDDMFAQNFHYKSQEKIGRADLIKLALRGGYPESVSLGPDKSKKWHRDYIDALLQRDLRQVANITRHHTMRELIRTLAAWSGKFMDQTAICAKLSLQRSTLLAYINALEMMYLVERVPAFTHTDYERTGKQEKIYMTDSGLAASLLNWKYDQVQFDADRSGKIIETFLYNEIATLVDVSDGKYALFHYRDREKREIDFLIERDDGALLGIEIKAGSVIASNAIKHLKWFGDHIAGDRPFTGIVLYTGEKSGKLAPNIQAVPVSMMW